MRKLVDEKVDWWESWLMRKFLSRYHNWKRTFLVVFFSREAAKQRYLSDETKYKYFHNIMSEYFVGTYGGGKPKPFRYTEIQRHRFGLKSKEAAEDRQVPDMPLAFRSSTGQLLRYNLRKLGELTYHLARGGQMQDLFTKCLFNYDWMFAKVDPLLWEQLSSHKSKSKDWGPKSRSLSPLI